jgi:hypothetical protein
MSRIIRCTQQSDLWLAARRGRITGSRLGDVMAPPTSKASNRKGMAFPAGSEALAKAEYRQELVVERIYGKAINHFVTRAMQDGAEREPFARMLYEADTSQVVELVGFALHPEWDWFGASADGLCGEDGGVELKCPTEAVHDSYAADVEALADEYKWQCLGCLTCFPERSWWDLCSFNPFAPDSIKLVKFRFRRADWMETIAAIEKESLAMHEQVEAIIAKRGLTPTVFTIMPREDREPDTDIPLPRTEAGDVDLGQLADQLSGTIQQ